MGDHIKLTLSSVRDTHGNKNQPIFLNIILKPDRLGPVLALWIALSFPLLAGLWEFLQTRKAILFSGILVKEMLRMKWN